MNEESQISGCYNFYLHQPGNSVGSPLNQMHRQQLELMTCYCRDTGGKRTRRTQCTRFNTLDNWGHETPTQSKKEKDRKERLKGHSPNTHNTLGWLHMQTPSTGL